MCWDRHTIKSKPGCDLLIGMDGEHLCFCDAFASKTLRSTC